MQKIRNGNTPQGIYAPLPQNLTDSESDKETNHQRASNHNSYNLKNNNYANDDSIKDTEMSSTYNNCNSLTSDCEDRYIENHMDIDNMTILQDRKKNEKMSLMRKTCFIISLLICLFTIIIFLWVLPCSDSSSCPAPNERVKTNNWNRGYEKLELKGMINVVDGIKGRSKNLVFMYRGDMIFEDPNNKKKNGIISLTGSLGQVAWFDEMANEPITIDCTLIDADKNGSPDCLIIDEIGQLGCINPISGQWLWHINIHNVKMNKKIDLLDFPLVLPDIDNDNVNDLLLTSNLGKLNHNNFIMISGSSGRIIGNSITIKECSFIHKLQLQLEIKISYNCINNDTELQKFVTLRKLYNLMTNNTINKKQYLNMNVKQHKIYGQRKETENQRNIYSVSGKQLIIENNGKCPNNCNVTVSLIEQKDNVIWNFNGTNMYGMVPAQLSFNNSLNNKSPIHGFVIKFWQFLNITETEYILNNKKYKREIFNNDNEFNIFSNIIVKHKSWKLPFNNNNNNNNNKNHHEKIRIPRNIKNNDTLLKNKIRFLKETIVLIVFNSTDTRKENTSRNIIVQYCNDDNDINFCQPDLNYQENSLLITDLDEDGSQELVSYYSTYINADNDDEWKLITYVQLLRLESELPKLYSNDSYN